MKDLIYMEKDKIYKLDNVQELYELIFGKEYFNLNEKQKLIKRYELAFYKIEFNQLDLDIVHTKMGILGNNYKVKSQNFDLRRAIKIDTERDFVISLCKIPYISILESKSSNNLLHSQEKEKYTGNYVLINNIIEKG